MFEVIFYTFNKKVNSTKRPTEDTSQSKYQVVAKDSINIMNPQVILNLSTGNAPESRNYAYIPSFDRYYFVDSWECNRGLWTANLSIDVLATYKNQIGSSSQYILRSSSEYDLSVPDNMYPALTTTSSIRDDAPQSPWVNNVADGMFVVGVVGTATIYYIMTPTIFQAFITYIMSDGYLDALIDGWSTLFPELKAQINPLQYISSIQWLPYPTTTPASVTTIKVGYVNVVVPIAWRVDGNSLVHYDHYFTVQRHPQSSRGNYLNANPWSSYTLFYPPWGQIQLDPDIVANSSRLTCYWYIDLRTGRGTLRVYGGNNHESLMAMVTAQVSVPYQVSQVINSGLGLTQLLQPVASLLTGNYLGAIGSTASAIGSGITGRIPSVKSVGSDGGMNSLHGLPSVLYEFKHIADEDLADRGRPLCKIRTISSLSGYVMVSDSHISISGATRNETSEINTLLEGGFFYE